MLATRVAPGETPPPKVEAVISLSCEPEVDAGICGEVTSLIGNMAGGRLEALLAAPTTFIMELRLPVP